MSRVKLTWRPDLAMPNKLRDGAKTGARLHWLLIFHRDLTDDAQIPFRRPSEIAA